METWVLRLPYLTPPLSANRAKATHWGPGHKAFQEIKNDAVYLAKHWQQREGLRPLGRCEVELVWRRADNRRIDPDNMSPTLKPLLDGLVAAGVLVDDSARYVARTSCRIVPRDDPDTTVERPMLVLVIREVPALQSA